MKYCALCLVSLLVLPGCAPEEPSYSSAPQPVPVSSAPAPVPTKAVPPAVPEASAQLSREALAAYGAGDGASALRLAEEALAASDANYEALALQGLIMAFDGAPDEGTALIERALALYPDYVQGYYDLAMALKLADGTRRLSRRSSGCSTRIRRMCGRSTASPRITRICATGSGRSRTCGRPPRSMRIT